MTKHICECGNEHEIDEDEEVQSQPTMTLSTPENYKKFVLTCEEAHRLTVLKCTRKGIKVDSKNKAMYTEEAQAIFNDYYDYLVEEYDI